MNERDSEIDALLEDYNLTREEKLRLAARLVVKAGAELMEFTEYVRAEGRQQELPPAFTLAPAVDQPTITG